MRLLVFASALLLIALTARADEAADPTRRAEASKLSVQGSAAWESGEYLSALADFEKAYSIFPSPNLRYNMGRALSDLGRDLEALEAFEEFMAKATDAPEKARGIAKAKIAVLEKRIARLSISCSIGGAQITVDGRIIGKAPLTQNVRVDPRAHQVSAELAGYAPGLAVASPRPGETIEIRLQLHKVGVASTPIKKRWWFWTILGSAAAASATAIALGVHYGVQSPHPITIHTDASMSLTKP